MRPTRWWAAAIVLALTGTASAQVEEEESDDVPTYGATGVADVPIAAGSELDPTASATVIRLDARPRTLETLDEALLDAPGARARRTGGFGGFSALSIRGADAQQTSVFLGDIPIASPDGSAFDLSSVPTWLLSRVEVYRGGAPAWLSSGAIGGVLRLMPRDDPGQRFEGALSAGSFDLGQGRVSASVGDDRLHVTTAAGLTTFGGRYPYVDDRRTVFDPSDDVVRERLGVDFLEASGMLSVRGRVGDVRLESAWLGTERTAGLGFLPSDGVDVTRGRRRNTRLVGGVSATLEELDRYRLSLALGIGLEQRAIADPLTQFGQLPRDTDDTLWRATARLAGTVRALDWLDVTFVGSYTHEAVAPWDALAVVVVPPSARDSAALALEGRAFGSIGDTRFEIRPSGRVEVMDARLFDLSDGDLGDRSSSTLVVPTGRLGVVLEPVRGIALSASGHASARAPSMAELFGDRAFLVGDTTLRSETSFGADGGIVLSGREGPVRGALDVRGFGSSVFDLIRYVRTAANQVTAQNVGRATLGGIEASLTGSFERYLHLTAAFTWLHARDENAVPIAPHDRALPLRPPFALYTRVGANSDAFEFVDRVSGFVDVEYVSESYADAANLVILSGRARVGLGTSITLFGLVSLELVVRDLFDARGVDVLGLPLAGRSFVGTLALRH